MQSTSPSVEWPSSSAAVELMGIKVISIEAHYYQHEQCPLVIVVTLSNGHGYLIRQYFLILVLI